MHQRVYCVPPTVKDVIKTMSINQDSPLFTMDEAANYLRIGRSSLYRLIKSGHIATVKMLPRKQLIEQKVLDQFVSNPSLKNQEWNHNGK